MKPGHILLALLINLIWGLSFPAAKIGVAEFQPFFFTGLRFLLVAVVLAPFLRPVRGRVREVVLVSLLMGVLHFSFMYLGIDVAGGVSAVAITIQLVAPFSLLLAILVLKETVGWRRLFAMALAFGGVVVLGFDPIVIEQLDGVALVTLAAFFAAAAMIMMRGLHGVAPLVMQAWMAAIAAPVLLAVSFAREADHLAIVMDAEPLPVAALLFTVVGTTIVAHGSWYKLLQLYPVNVLMPFGLLAPVFGVAFGVLLFNEALTWRFLAGAAMTLGGVAVLHLRQSKG